MSLKLPTLTIYNHENCKNPIKASQTFQSNAYEGSRKRMKHVNPVPVLSMFVDFTSPLTELYSKLHSYFPQYLFYLVIY